MELTSLPTKQTYKGLGIVFYRPDVDEDVCWGVVKDGEVIAQDLTTEEVAYAYADGWLSGRIYALRWALEVQAGFARECDED